MCVPVCFGCGSWSAVVFVFVFVSSVVQRARKELPHDPASSLFSSTLPLTRCVPYFEEKTYPRTMRSNTSLNVWSAAAHQSELSAPKNPLTSVEMCCNDMKERFRESAPCVTTDPFTPSLVHHASINIIAFHHGKKTTDGRTVASPPLCTAAASSGPLCSRRS